MSWEPPVQGFVFWPVGTGDSTTIFVSDETVVQVDLRSMACADDDDDPHTSIVDRLVEHLPEVDGKPYLSVFVLTHPDEDHCLGFTDVLERVNIGELWFSPRVFREYKKDLCEDALAFRDEAARRVKKTIRTKGCVESGDRVHIIGYDDLLQEDDYAGFPREQLTVPGNAVTELDGLACASVFRAYIHAPFKDDCDGERNDTSIGMQVTLRCGDAVGRALLLGDLCYPTVNRIFTCSSADDLAWNVLLTPHHCSKSVMYWQEEGENTETLKQKLLDAIEGTAQTPGYIVASCEPIPASNKPGDNPPHAKARHRYEEIVPDEFICTHEHPDTAAPEPIVFALDESGLTYETPAAKKRAGGSEKLAAGIAAGRGAPKPPTSKVGFGRR